MAAAKGKPAARAWVEIGANDKKLRAALANIRKRLNSFFASIKRAAALAGKAIAAGIAAGLAASIALAVKFENVLTRTKGIFQEMSGDAEAFARALAGRVGKSVSDTLDMVNEIGASFRAAGLQAATSFQLASRTAAAAAVLSDRLGVDSGTVQDALMQASRGRATGLQRLGLGITPQELKDLAESLNLDVQDSADQIRLYAAVLEQVEARIETNTASIGAALDDGENASQRLARIYAQIKDQLTELGQKMLPVFSNLLAGVSVMLSQIGDAFSGGGLMGVVRMFLNAAKPFTDVIVAGLKDVFSWVLANMDSLFRTVIHNMRTSITNGIREATGRDIAEGSFTMLFRPVEMSAGRTESALEALSAHLTAFGADADAAAKKLKDDFNEALGKIKESAADLRTQINEELGPRAGKSVTEAAGTFSAAAAFALEARVRNQEQRTRREIESNTKDSKDELARQSTILQSINQNTRMSATMGAAFS